jgi:hypothetical protein
MTENRFQRKSKMTEIKNAIIKKVSLGTEDHGSLTAWLHLDYGGVEQGFGGYSLYLPKTVTYHRLLSGAGHFITRCLEVAGVHKWNDLVGKAIRVKATAGGVDAIGHIINDDWFCPSEDFKDDDEDSE